LKVLSILKVASATALPKAL